MAGQTSDCSLAAAQGVACSEPELPWGQQQEAPEKSRVVMGAGSHKHTKESHTHLWESALSPAPPHSL